MTMHHCLYATEFFAHCVPAPSGESGWDFAWSFCLPPDFVGFAGHFPGRPILPAFLQVVVSRMLVEKHVGRILETHRITRSKFTEPVLPSRDMRVLGRVED
ncbi:MAG: hypothetical protein KAI66_10325, partial [Lentisphaeria bacterium]|nr:hypothetical protein [Lentisphaeria bacterium]